MKNNILKLEKNRSSMEKCIAFAKNFSTAVHCK